MSKTDSIVNAQKLPCGARFFRCALQVNPFDYIVRHSKDTVFNHESDYNAAIVEVCQRIGIEVIAITDHQRCSTGQSLAEAARTEGIVVFIGAELETKEGVHMLLLFEPDASWERCNGILGDCGIHDQANPPSAIKYDVHELLRESVRWNCICVAAHVASEKGLLQVLDNQARAVAWKSEYLPACSLPGPAKDAPQNLRPILLNKNSDYLRVGTQSREASAEELERLFQQRGAFRLEVRGVSGSSMDYFDYRRLNDYFQRIRSQETPGMDDTNAWQNLLVNTEFLVEEDDTIPATVAGLLLFCAKRIMPLKNG